MTSIDLLENLDSKGSKNKSKNKNKRSDNTHGEELSMKNQINHIKSLPVRKTIIGLFQERCNKPLSLSLKSQELCLSLGLQIKSSSQKLATSTNFKKMFNLIFSHQSLKDSKSMIKKIKIIESHWPKI